MSHEKKSKLKKSVSEPEHDAEEKVNDRREQVLNIINGFDADNNGCLDWEEFGKLCKHFKMDDQQCETWWRELGGISTESKIQIHDIVAKFTMTSV